MDQTGARRWVNTTRYGTKRRCAGCWLRVVQRSAQSPTLEFVISGLITSGSLKHNSRAASSSIIHTSPTWRSARRPRRGVVVDAYEIRADGELPPCAEHRAFQDQVHSQLSSDL